MTFSFPLTINDFASQLRMQSAKLRLVGQQEISGMASGEIIVADLAPKYWEAEVNLINMENADARRIQGLIETLDESMNDFYWYDPRSEYPIADPDGSILGSATVTTLDLRNNNKEIKFQGLPAGYVLSPGDFFSFDFGSSPSHRAFHRIVAGATADGSGDTGWIEVRPHIRTGAAVDDTIRLIRASFQARMVPGSFDPGTVRKTMTSGMSFKCRQVI